ncbi:DUF237 domain-containing protein [Mycoplasmoides pneumoniae]|nr:hypothetical protein Y1241N_2460 [Mycoplasmoides pneumoniae]GLL60176.1 hypothetical protein OA571N_0580 [Mycoplasmoides pneumoniae]GLL61087.1 hypothetical protein OA631U_2500 [Mycoplasmoides pneumoniae]
MSQHGSSTDPSFVVLRNNSSLSRDGKSRLLEFGNDLGFSKEETDAFAKQKDWNQNFVKFQKQFENKLLDPKNFSLTDVYNLFSGFQQSVTATVQLMNELQTKVNEANNIFPVEAFKVPKVPEKLFGFVNQGFFPKLNPKGLNIADNVASLFEQYSLKQASLKDFDILLEKKNDIVLEHKVRYNFALQFNFETTYVGTGGEINLQFALQASTTNFSSLEELQASFSKTGDNLTAQLFWKPTVTKLVSGENDLTHIAQTAIGESLFDSRVDLSASIINSEATLKTAEATFTTQVLNPFKAEREKALAIKKAEEEKIKKELEEQKKRQEELAKQQRDKEALQKSLWNFQEFISYWNGQGKDVKQKEQFIQALEAAFSTNWNEVFNLLIAGFRSAIQTYYKDGKADQSQNAKIAFGEKGIQFPKSGPGLDGIFMSDFLRGNLTGNAHFDLKLKKVEVKNTQGKDAQGNDKKASINWQAKQNNFPFRQVNPWDFSFEVELKYEGSYGLYPGARFLNLFGSLGIPNDWKGEMSVKFVLDGKTPQWIADKPDYPGSLFKFEKNQLKFTPHVKEHVHVENKQFMEKLKSQNLHNLELATGATKPPVVDLASYLHYLILNHK